MSFEEDKIILVDSLDRERGCALKLEAHTTPMLHRAFSIFILNNGKMLLQKRAECKYHSGGLWTNACCSHPRVGEKLEEAIHRRLVEELGFDTELEEVGSFVYYHRFDEMLYEYEYDHVFVGLYDGEVLPNADEMSEIKWIDLNELSEDIVRSPENYTVWFNTAAPMVLAKKAVWMSDGQYNGK